MQIELNRNQLSLFETNKLIVSIYDYTGRWAQPYIDAGYPVILWDYKVEGCILQRFDRLLMLLEDAQQAGYRVYGFLFAPPCTAFAGSGAQYWKVKDVTPADPPYAPWTITEQAASLVLIALHLVDLFKPSWWVLENPVGRIEKVVPELKPWRRMVFHPCDFGDPYTKKTILWGDFNPNLKKKPAEPIRSCKQGSWLMQLGGKSERTKELRSATPMGFARAFFDANK